MSVINYLRANDRSRPGQQLLPAGVVVLLKSLKILFGTDKNGQGQDYDPTISLINHIIECIGALRDVNKVYSAKGSVAAKSIGVRMLFGLTSELSGLLLGKFQFNFLLVNLNYANNHYRFSDVDSYRI